MHPTLSFKISCSRDIWDDSSVPVQIWNDTLALHLMTWGAEFAPNDWNGEVLICNWKSGQLLNYISVPGTCSPRFLTPTSLVLLCKTVELDDPTPAIQLAIYDDVQKLPSDKLPPAGTLIGDDLSPLQPSLVFRFPTLSSIFSPAKQTEPVWAAPGACRMDHGQSLFIPDSSCEVLRIVLLTVTESRASSTPFQVLVSKAQLLSHIARSKVGPENGPVVLLWQDWGEEATRWIESDGPPAKRMVHGTRWVRLPEDGPRCITLLEFHGPTVRRFSSSSTARHIRRTKRSEELPNLMRTRSESEETTHVHTVVKPSILETSIFCYPIVSRLPYRVAVLPEPVEHSGQDWRINGERIVGTPVSKFRVYFDVAFFDLSWLVCSDHIRPSAR